VRIDRSTAQLLKVGHCDDQGNFLLPAAEHPWHMRDTHYYCIRVGLDGGHSLVAPCTPCIELALSYFSSSSELLSRLFLPPFEDAKLKLYSKVQYGQPDGGIKLDLADGSPRGSAPGIARDDRARHAAAWIGTTLLRLAPASVGDIYPQCLFPFLRGNDDTRGLGKMAVTRRATALDLPGLPAALVLASLSLPFAEVPDRRNEAAMDHNPSVGGGQRGRLSLVRCPMRSRPPVQR